MTFVLRWLIMNVIVSKSLIVNKRLASLTKENESDFCLGLVGWCPCSDCSDFEMQSVKAGKSVQKKRCGGKITEGHCSSDMCDEVLELKKMKPDSVCPLNTLKPISGLPMRNVETQLVKSNTSQLEKKQKTDIGANRSTEERFSFDMDDEELKDMKGDWCPANTLKNNEWAMRNFETWRSARNKRFPDDKCPDDVFHDKETACEWLCKFVMETRKSDGGEYTRRSIYLLLAGLQRYIRRSHLEEDINIFSDNEFKPLKKVCDALFKKLHSKGIGATTKSAAILSFEDEKKLWDTGVLNLDTPLGLLRAVFFYNGKNFCLRGGAEQRDLKISQFQRQVCSVEGKSVGCYIYHEFGSKNRQGGFNNLNVENKVVRQFENTTGSGVCHVKILDKYLEKIPQEAKQADVFYLTPKPVSYTTDPSQPWFSKVPVGP